MSDFPVQMLDDGIAVETRNESWAIMLPKHKTPVKPRGVKLNDAETKKANGVGVYEVPKTDSFGRIQLKLADGSMLVVQRYKAIPQDEREAMHKAATERGLKMLPLTKKAGKEPTGPAKRVNLDDLYK